MYVYLHVSTVHYGHLKIIKEKEDTFKSATSDTNKTKNKLDESAFLNLEGSLGYPMAVQISTRNRTQSLGFYGDVSYTPSINYLDLKTCSGSTRLF